MKRRRGGASSCLLRGLVHHPPSVHRSLAPCVSMRFFRPMQSVRPPVRPSARPGEERGPDADGPGKAPQRGGRVFSRYFLAFTCRWVATTAGARAWRRASSYNTLFVSVISGEADPDLYQPPPSVCRTCLIPKLFLYFSHLFSNIPRSYCVVDFRRGGVHSDLQPSTPPPVVKPILLSSFPHIVSVTPKRSQKPKQ